MIGVTERPETSDLRKLGNLREISNSNVDSLMPSPPSKNQTSAIAVKKHPKVDIKSFIAP